MPIKTTPLPKAYIWESRKNREIKLMLLLSYTSIQLKLKDCPLPLLYMAFHQFTGMDIPPSPPSTFPSIDFIFNKTGKNIRICWEICIFLYQPSDSRPWAMIKISHNDKLNLEGGWLCGALEKFSIFCVFFSGGVSETDNVCTMW